MNTKIATAIKKMPQLLEIIAGIQTNLVAAEEALKSLDPNGFCGAKSFIIKLGPIYCECSTTSAKLTSRFAPQAATTYADRMAAALVARRIRNGMGDRAEVVVLGDELIAYIARLKETLNQLI